MKAILVIDVQNGFMKASNAYLVRNINRLLAKHPFGAVFCTQFVNTNSTLFAQSLNWHAMQAPPATNIAITIPSNAVVFQKSSYGLTAQHLEQLLNLNVSQIYLCGTDIDACVLAIAFQLFDAGIQPMFIIDCCDTSSTSLTLKESATSILKRSFGAQSIITSKQLT